MVKTSEDALTCASMPAEVVVAVGTDPLVWWLLVMLTAVLILFAICCLGAFIYILKLRKAAVNNGTLAHSPIAGDATAPPVAEVLDEILHQLPSAEVQLEIRRRMRPEMEQPYGFTPAGERYHLDGCTVTSGNRRSFELLPCPLCVIGRSHEMDEVAPPQVFFANTRIEPYGSGLHYHADRFCMTGTLYEKTMCRHCREARNFHMFMLRLEILRPYVEQQMNIQSLQRRHSTPEAEMTLGPILFAGQTR